MNILLFGISNVGKTTTGVFLARELGYMFYDLDEEVKTRFLIPLEQFIQQYPLARRDRIRGQIIGDLLEQPGNKVLAVTQMSYPIHFEKYLSRADVMAIELQDTPENIYSRLVFSDENDHVYRDDAYRDAHRKYYLRELREDIAYYSQSFRKISNKYMINNDPPETVVKKLIDQYALQSADSHTQS